MMFWRIFLSALFSFLFAILIYYLYLDQRRKNTRKAIDVLFSTLKKMENKYLNFVNFYLNSILNSENSNDIEKITDELITQLKPEISVAAQIIKTNSISDYFLQREKEFEVFGNLFILGQTFMKEKNKQDIEQKMIEQIRQIIKSDIGHKRLTI